MNENKSTRLRLVAMSLTLEEAALMLQWGSARSGTERRWVARRGAGPPEQAAQGQRRGLILRSVDGQLGPLEILEERHAKRQRMARRRCDRTGAGPS